jgi:hypothetical protein
MRSANEARLAAAARFARHSRMDDVGSAAAAATAAATAGASAMAAQAAPPAAAAASEEDWNDYDAFLEARGPRPPLLPSPSAEAPRAETLQREANVLAADAGSAPKPFVSAWTASLGQPVSPANADVAQRRLCFMRFVLMHSLNAPTADTAGATVGADAAAAASARAALDARVATAAASVGATPDWFDEEEMERRRPALFHEFVGVYRRRAVEAGIDEEEEEQEEEREVEEDADEQMEERKESDPAVPSSSRSYAPARPRRRPGPRVNSAASVRRNPAQLPATLSQLLLHNYDRRQVRQQALGEQQQLPSEGEPHAVGAASTVANIAADGAAADEDDAAGTGAGHSSMSVTFSSDDGAPALGAWSRSVTASADAAERAREIVDDDMDKGGSAGARERQRQEWDARRKHKPPARNVRANVDRNGAVDAVSASLASSGISDAADDAADSAEISSSDARWLRAECLRVFQRLFLDGFDAPFLRYDLIDAPDGPAAEWEALLDQQPLNGPVDSSMAARTNDYRGPLSLADGSTTQQRAQEAYFDAQDSEADQTPASS